MLYELFNILFSLLCNLLMLIIMFILIILIILILFKYIYNIEYFNNLEIECSCPNLESGKTDMSIITLDDDDKLNKLINLNNKPIIIQEPSQTLINITEPEPTLIKIDDLKLETKKNQLRLVSCINKI
jgi:hypothetical protein